MGWLVTLCDWCVAILPCQDFYLAEELLDITADLKANQLVKEMQLISNQESLAHILFHFLC